MAKRLIVLPVIAVVPLVAFLVATNMAGGETAQPVLDRVSNQGTDPPASLGERDQLALERMQRPAAEVRLLGEHGPRAFYRVGSDCFGTGATSVNEYRLDAVVCTPAFPSKARPLLDMTVFKGSGEPYKRPTALSIWKSEGFAADGVASVGFKNSVGEIVGKTQVIGNTYSHSSIPAETLDALVALDSSGEVVASVPVRHRVP